MDINNINNLESENMHLIMWTVLISVTIVTTFLHFSIATKAETMQF